MKIYVVRHGESENNLKEKWTGWYDTPLTEKGIEDAKEAGKILKGITFDKIYASDLSRAIDTARTAIPNCEYETSAQLREINVGKLENQPNKVLNNEQLAHVFVNGYEDYDGESNEHFYNRVAGFAKGLESAGYENVAIFTHAGWLRRMLNFVMGVRLPRENVVCNNCTVGIFEYKDGVWRLYSWINVT